MEDTSQREEIKRKIRTISPIHKNVFPLQTQQDRRQETTANRKNSEH